MTHSELYYQLNSLPNNLLKEVSDFAEFLKKKNKKAEVKNEREFGCARGLFKMSDDFDEPLEDFKEYM